MLIPNLKAKRFDAAISRNRYYDARAKQVLFSLVRFTIALQGYADFVTMELIILYYH